MRLRHQRIVFDASTSPDTKQFKLYVIESEQNPLKRDSVTSFIFIRGATPLRDPSARRAVPEARMPVPQQS